MSLLLKQWVTGVSGGVSWSSYWATRTPTSLIVTAMADTTTDFSWTAGADEPEGYKLKISTDGVTYTDKATVAGNVTTAQATGLTAGVLYYFKVVAYRGTNESDPTNIYDTRFKITVDTTKAGSADTHFVLPVTANTGNYYVDWGDGGAEETFSTTGNKDHTYSATGTYQVMVRGGLTAISFANGGDNAKLMTIDNWGNLAWSSMAGAFLSCAAMTGSYIDAPNTAAVTDMSYMFRNCTVFNQSVANFNTAKVTNMAYMFRGCAAFNQSVANFNTAKVTNMSYMFFGCTAFKQSLATFSLASINNTANLDNICANCNINATGTTTNYDATLVAWAAADVPNSLNFNGGTSKYSAGAAATARASLKADDLWTITDGGQA